MVNARSGPIMYKARVSAMILKKPVSHTKAMNSQTVQDENMPDFSEQSEWLPEPSSVDKASKPKMDMMDVSMPLLAEEESEFLLRHSWRKRQVLNCYRLSILDAKSEEPNPVLKRPRRLTKKNYWL
eukprot:g41228.t1